MVFNEVSEARRVPWGLLAAAVLGAVAAGCKVGPSFTHPDIPAETRYTAERLPGENASAEDTAQRIALGKDMAASWWTLFGSEAIDRIVMQAVERNRTLAASRATLAQTQELAAAQAGARLPQLGLTGGVGRQKYGDEFLGGFFDLPPFTYFAVGAVVGYTVDYTGGVKRGIEQQFALAEAARHQLDAAYLTVSGQAVLQVLAIASAREQIACVDNILAQDRDNLKLVQTAFDNGAVARTDILSAKTQIAGDMALLPPLRQELARARHALSIVLGEGPASELPTELQLSQITLPREVPVRLPSELAHRRPDILAAEARLHAATSAVGVAESNLYPKIQLSASVGQQSVRPEQIFNASNTAWSLISGLTAPVFDGGTLRAEKRAAVDALRASAAEYQEIVLESFGQVADLLEALEHDAEQLDAQNDAQQTAQSSLDLARQSYQEGNAGVLQVLDAERAYQRARLGYVRAEAQRYIDTAELFLALGGTSPASPR
jgi:NodT family efflux transporter outer membrane factor (OMF) lipoprotein